MSFWNLNLSPTASRFEVGSPSFISFLGAAEAMKIILEFGIESVERRIIALTDRLIDAVKGFGLKLQTLEERQHRSGIVNFKVYKPMEVVQRLSQKSIVVSARVNGIRVSPHFYNMEEEIDRLIEEVERHGITHV